VRPRVVQVDDELVETVDHRRDGARVGLGPGRFEVTYTTSCRADRLLARNVLAVEVGDLPDVGADRVLVDLGHLGTTVPGAVEQAPLAACGREHLVDRGTWPRVPSVAVSTGEPSLRATMSFGNVTHASVASADTPSRWSRTALPWVVIP
jgi:hypothetical protein